MKILTVVNNLEKGGTQRAAQTFAEAYLKLNHDSRIIALEGLGPRYEEIKDTIPVWEGLTAVNNKEISSWGPDIIHIHSHGPIESDIKKVIGLKSENTRVIETNVFSKPSPWAQYIDISYQLSFWALWVFNLRGGSKYNSAVVPYPIKCEAFKKPSIDKVELFKKKIGIPNDAYVIGRIGQSYSGKWSPMLIKAFNELSESIPKLYLLIVNPPENIISESQNSIFKSKIIHIPRIIGDDNLSLAYGTMDTMVHIAHQGESFGMVLPESILAGTTVVTLSTPWADNSQCEVVGHNKGGLIANDFKSLKKAITKIYSNRKDLTFGTELGKLHIEKEYDYLKVANEAIVFSKKNQTNKKSFSKSIIKILNNSFGRPSLLTKVFLLANNNRFRELTIYSSGYKNINKLFFALKRRLLKK